MPNRRRLLPLLALPLAGLTAGCLLPSDHSARLQVTFATFPTVYLGDTVQFRLLSGPGRDTVPAADVIFRVEDPSVLALDASGRGIGLQAGATHVFAQPRMADVAPADIIVVVSERLEIDTVSPRFALLHVGDTLHLAGWGLNPQASALRIGGTLAPVKSFTRAVASSANGYGVLSVYVPPGDTTLRITLTRGATVVRDTHHLTIAEEDVLEPNDAAPRHLGPLGTGIRYPALSLEAAPVGTPAHRDWYTFDNEKAQPVTIVLKPEHPTLEDQLYVQLTDSLDAAGNPSPTGWVLGNGLSYCRGAWVSGYRGTLDSQVLAADTLPAGRYHVMVSTRTPISAPQLYELRIAPRFRSMAQGTTRIRDSYRCPASDDTTGVPWIHLVSVPPAVYDTSVAAIDYIGDIDWYVMQIDSTRVYLQSWAQRTYPWLRGGVSMGEAGDIEGLHPRRLIAEVFTFAGRHIGGGPTDVGPGGAVWGPSYCIPAPGRYLVSVSDGGEEPVRYYMGPRSLTTDNMGYFAEGWGIAPGRIPCPTPTSPTGRTPR